MKVFPAVQRQLPLCKEDMVCSDVLSSTIKVLVLIPIAFLQDVFGMVKRGVFSCLYASVFQRVDPETCPATSCITPSKKDVYCITSLVKGILFPVLVIPALMLDGLWSCGKYFLGICCGEDRIVDEMEVKIDTLIGEQVTVENFEEFLNLPISVSQIPKFMNGDANCFAIASFYMLSTCRGFLQSIWDRQPEKAKNFDQTAVENNEFIESSDLDTHPIPNWCRVVRAYIDACFYAQNEGEQITFGESYGDFLREDSTQIDQKGKADDPQHLLAEILAKLYSKSRAFRYRIGDNPQEKGSNTITQSTSTVTKKVPTYPHQEFLQFVSHPNVKGCSDDCSFQALFERNLWLNGRPIIYAEEPDFFVTVTNLKDDHLGSKKNLSSKKKAKEDQPTSEQAQEEKSALPSKKEAKDQTSNKFSEEDKIFPGFTEVGDCLRLKSRHVDRASSDIDYELTGVIMHKEGQGPIGHYFAVIKSGNQLPNGEDGFTLVDTLKRRDGPSIREIPKAEVLQMMKNEKYVLDNEGNPKRDKKGNRILNTNKMRLAIFTKKVPESEKR